MKIIITIPAFNEEKTIGKIVTEIKEIMNSTKYNYEIVVVSDGSKDKTEEVAGKAGAKVFSHPYNCGLAETFRTEIRKCLKLKADIIVHTDADGQYLAKEIPKLIEPIINKEADLVLGSRFKGTIESMPLIKKIGNILFSRTISKIVKFKVSDCQTGFRAFTKEIAEKIKLISNYTYTQEQIIKAAHQKFRIIEVPVYFAKREDKSRLMKSSFEYAIKAWVNIIRIYRDYDPLKFFLKIGGTFLLFGISIGLYFTYLHFFLGGIKGHLGLLFLMMGLLMMGIQIVLFGFLADRTN